MSTVVKVNWSGRALVEIDPDIQSGAAVLRGTRVPVSAIVDNAEYGLSTREISEQFAVSEAEVRAILTYADGHRIAHPVR